MVTETVCDFIEAYPDMLSEQSCRSLISIFDSSPLTTRSTTGYGNDIVSNRVSTNLALTPENCGPLLTEITDALKNAVQRYFETYPVLKNNSLRFEQFGMYRYRDQNEFFDWHADTNAPQMRYRFISMVLYLNTVQLGGETEFKYFPRKIKPTQGTLVLFPSSWTHEHRARPPLSGSKYVIVNWARYGEYPIL